ncbi:MAG: sigma-70 family RNA polymerase sigma factor [Bacteroidota bacterium]
MEPLTQAQQELYGLFAPSMMAVCYRYAKSKAEAEDILQESFIKVFKNLPRYKDNGSLEGWIRRIVVNTAIDMLRKEKYVHRHVEIQDYQMGTGESAALHDLSLEELYAVIQRLPEGYRMVFNLYAIEGFSHAEVGKKLGITESTSRSQYTRARNLLKKWVEQMHETKKTYAYRDVI